MQIDEFLLTAVQRAILRPRQIPLVHAVLQLILDLDSEIIRHMLGHGGLSVRRQLTVSRREHPVLLRRHH